MIPTLGVIDICDPADTLQMASTIESLGYRRLWVTEHRSRFQSSAPTVLAGAIGAATRRISVGTAGIKLRYRSPLHVAEEAVLLAHLFPGRIDLGVIGGLEAEPIHSELLDGRDYDPLGYEKRVRQLAAHIELVTSRRCASMLSPATSPRMWVCSNSLASARLAAEAGLYFAYGYAASQSVSSSDHRAVIDEYLGCSSDARAIPPYVVMVCTGSCAEEAAEALRYWNAGSMATGVLTRAAPMPAFLGTPRDCCDQLTELAASLGVNEVIVRCIGPTHSDRLKSYGLLAAACSP